MISLLVHINNADPIKLEVDEIPSPKDNAIVGKNPREKGDKEVTYLEEGVTTLIIPWWRITFVEVLPSESEETEFPLPFRLD
ncbi:hypothetical protein FBR02_13070 [Anaerolineae bacterium CFX9]|nr:hypothetical protein [Kamptonema cortianum]MDL1901690.1 hypothetical protein [Anaerolineae bacterium CFX9]